MQEKDKNSITPKDINYVFSDLVRGDKYVQYVLRKLDKISAAVYLISGYIDKDESLRTKMRESSLALIHQKMALMNKSHTEAASRELLTSLFQLETYLEVSVRANLISEMNYSVLKEECDHVAVLLHDHMSSVGNKGVPISRDFFKTEEVKNQARHGTENSELKLSEKTERVDAPKTPVKNVLYSSQSPVDGGRVAEKKKGRREVILNLLKERSGISIKDFSNLIKDCSEKTIQRELLEMVDEGVVEKKGERRWSTYSLKIV